MPGDLIERAALSGATRARQRFSAGVGRLANRPQRALWLPTSGRKERALLPGPIQKLDKDPLGASSMVRAS